MKKKEPVPKYNGSKPTKSVCTCGHIGDCPKSDHEDMPAAIGHGRCKVKGCNCPQFTWKDFV